MRTQSLQSQLRAARTEASASLVRTKQLERAIADFERLITDLNSEIKKEEDRTNIRDPSHFAYPVYAKAAMTRRDNLTRSIEVMRVTLTEAQQAAKNAGDSVAELLQLEEARERAADAYAAAS